MRDSGNVDFWAGAILAAVTVFFFMGIISAVTSRPKSDFNSPAKAWVIYQEQVALENIRHNEAKGLK